MKQLSRSTGLIPTHPRRRRCTVRRNVSSASVGPVLVKSGGSGEFTDESIYQQAFYQGNLPGFERGVNLEVIEDDGSDGFQKQHEKLAARGL